MTPDFNDIDFLSDARENVTEQFKDKEVFDKYLQIMLSGISEVQQVIKDLIQKRSIDEARGEQLDIIGRIVGQERTLISADLYEYFGFQGAPNALGFGTLSDPSVGGYFYSSGNPLGGNITLDDSVYRLFIKSKILKNRTASTPEELIQFLSFLFSDAPIFLEEGNAHLTINIGIPLSSFEQNLLSYVSYSQGYPSRLIPKTTGVGIQYAEFDNINGFFAFDGVPGALGFGEYTGQGWDDSWGDDWGGTSSEDGGGIFASYIF